MMFKRDSKSKRSILAISSGGGHWVELIRLYPAFEGLNLNFATVNKSYIEDLSDFGDIGFFLFDDVTRWNKVKWIKTTFQIFLIILKTRPDFIVTTGALPGFIAIKIGKLFGAKTIWLDSIANAEELSAAGNYAGSSVDLWLTQWEHLEQVGGPLYRGSVL